MKQVTIRSIPDEVKKTVQKEAERKGVSLNKAIISLLERAMGTKAPEKKKRVLYHDLDHLAGDLVSQRDHRGRPAVVGR